MRGSASASTLDFGRAGMRAAALLALCGSLAGCEALKARLSGGETLGYVLASYDFLFHQTPGAKAECPRGFAPSNREEWEAQFPTEAQRKAHLTRCLAITNRGPNCENVWVTPQVVADPLPYLRVEGKQSHGVDLDGTDGAATSRTCAHENFVGLDGTKGVDNQYYRFLGCDEFVQGGQHHSPDKDKERTIQYQVNRVLLEVKGVQDRRNDDDVQVVLYRGKDPLMVDGEDKAIAWQSQRIDEAIPPIQLRGKITDGVLITEPKDVFWEDMLLERRLLIRGMSLRLKLAGTRAEGLRVGYVDVERLWQSYSHTAKWGGAIYGSSGPAAYKALHELADGNKDPKTGTCSSLSSARKFEFVRAYLIPPGAAQDGKQP